jgi:signal transduction histidine kinase
MEISGATLDDVPAAARMLSLTEPDRVGHGLHGMRERVRLLGGSLETGVSDEGGYRVVARLPLNSGGADT